MNSAVVSLKVRCAAVFALGTFVGNSAERTDHSTTIDHNVAMMLAQLINDGSPVVRKVSWLLNVGIGQRDFYCILFTEPKMFSSVLQFRFDFDTAAEEVRWGLFLVEIHL